MYVPSDFKVHFVIVANFAVVVRKIKPQHGREKQLLPKVAQHAHEPRCAGRSIENQTQKDRQSEPKVFAPESSALPNRGDQSHAHHSESVRKHGQQTHHRRLLGRRHGQNTITHFHQLQGTRGGSQDESKELKRKQGKDKHTRHWEP